ncbi:MAG: PEP-CTERM system histidine kinase PrsK, partial [Gammaproteobacteria bacterium]|nr:PEP-CTERM system histidine kinase PrsK [Gammaproteobacteria bacterium]
MNIGFYSYLFALIAYFTLTLLLFLSWKGRQFGILLVLASLFMVTWAGVSAAIAASLQVPVALYQMAEILHSSGWCILLLRITGQNQDLKKHQGTWTSIFFLTITCAFIIAIALPTASQFTTLVDIPTSELIIMIWVVLSIIGMLLIEQIYRNSEPEERWAIKYLCLGIGCIFAYDFFMFSEALLFKQLSPELWKARGVVNGIVVPLIAISIARNPEWSMGIHVSRHVVFHSATLVGAGIYLLAMAAVGYFIRFYGGTWGGVLQVIFLFGTGLLLIILLFSGKIRAKTRTILSKHFFSYKYDYREEWLRFTQTMDASEDPVPERIIRAMAALVKSNAGTLWVRNMNGNYEILAHWNMPAPESTDSPSLDQIVDFITETHWVIDIDEYDNRPDIYGDLTLPSWLESIPNAWLLIPLIFKTEVLGIVLTKRSDLQQSINWEDRDLLKMAGHQAASYLAQFQSDQQLIQARQFEAFNRLSAYVVHDLKNILAQQSLIVSNAERHKHNPEFIDDVISTIDNSVSRMTRLMEQMRSGMRGTNLHRVELSELLSIVVTNRSNSGQTPVPTLNLPNQELFVDADREQLTTVFSHIIQNAQEATHEDGQVSITLHCNAQQATVEIKDDGAGMDLEFIRDRLFRPFDTTKGLTG